jgi:hypothetical protein
MMSRYPFFSASLLVLLLSLIVPGEAFKKPLTANVQKQSGTTVDGRCISSIPRNPFLGTITGASGYLILDEVVELDNVPSVAKTTSVEDDEELLLTRTMMLARGGF